MTNSKTVYGYAGKILRVNLSNGALSTEPTLPYAKQWLGSTGIAIKILYDELKPWVTPYDPANKVIFGAGALMGTTAPGACKSSISTLGPMTGGWASGLSDSYVGGQLKYAGYDVVVLRARRIPRYTCGLTTIGLNCAMLLTCGARQPGRPLIYFGKTSTTLPCILYPLDRPVKTSCAGPALSRIREGLSAGAAPGR